MLPQCGLCVSRRFAVKTLGGHTHDKQPNGVTANVDADVIIIGAGLSGLSCGLRLQQAGIKPILLDAADRPGGRIASDHREGFLLDRGFQVLQT
jgi:NADPH-dependent 2,4-dienoyl-CoA reductase/sulfur reductase-like enzyme